MMEMGYVRKKLAMTWAVHCHFKCFILSVLLMHVSHCSPDNDLSVHHNNHGVKNDFSKPSQPPDYAKLSEGDMAGISLAQSSTRKEAELFLDHLFTKYGQEGVMTFEGFEHLLQSLGIGNVTIVDHDLQDHYSESGFIEFHEDHRHILHDHSDHDHDENHGDHEHSHDDHDHSHDDSHHGNHQNNNGHGNRGVNQNRGDYRQSGNHSHNGDSDAEVGRNYGYQGQKNRERTNDRHRNLRNNGGSHHSNRDHSGHDHGNSHGNNNDHSRNHDNQNHRDNGQRAHDRNSGQSQTNGHGDSGGHDDHSDHHGHADGKSFDHKHDIHHQYDHDHSVHHNPPSSTPDPNDIDDSDDKLEWFDFFGFAEEIPQTATENSKEDDEQYSGDDDAAAYYYDLVGFADMEDGTDVQSPSDANDQDNQSPSNDGKNGESATTKSIDKKSHQDGARRGNRRNRKNRHRHDDNNQLPTTPSYMEGQSDVSTRSASSDQHESRWKRSAALAKSSDFLEERKCLTAQEILATYHIIIKRGITKEDFVNLCPAIVYQIDEHACTDDVIPVQCTGLQGYELRQCITKYSHDHGSHTGLSLFNIKPKVWGYAILAVTIISLVGLLSVAIVPVMQKVFYNYLIQFLVALAIGSLTGDAMLHLIPHAIDGSHGDGGDHGSHGHDSVYKGLIVLLGIYVFFTMERFMDFWTQRRQRKRKLKMLKSDKYYIRADTSETIGEKLSHHALQKRSVEHIDMSRLSGEDIPKLLEDSDFQDGTKDEVAFEGHSKDMEGHHGHGHSHGDGKVPESIAAIAWMVIMGDGLHNFSDGLAIGAAFANSITGGLSTSIAVFCHELPHELGDFAVLLRAGMSVKQALFYNIVSSVLCFVGVVIGVVIGNINEASLWIFALTAGIFIYISMVDMLPEITNPSIPARESRWLYFMAQLFGITTGVCIMLVIALFEEKIRLNFDDSQL